MLITNNRQPWCTDCLKRGKYARHIYTYIYPIHLICVCMRALVVLFICSSFVRLALALSFCSWNMTKFLCFHQQKCCKRKNTPIDIKCTTSNVRCSINTFDAQRMDDKFDFQNKPFIAQPNIHFHFNAFSFEMNAFVGCHGPSVSAHVLIKNQIHTRTHTLSHSYAHTYFVVPHHIEYVFMRENIQREYKSIYAMWTIESIPAVLSFHTKAYLVLNIIVILKTKMKHSKYC